MSVSLTVTATSAMVSSNQPIACLAERSMLIAVSHPSMAQWADQFALAEPTGGISETTHRVANLLSALDIEGAQDVVVVHAGWSEMDNAAVAFMFRRSRGFQPRRIDRGYAQHPELYTPAPGLHRIASLGSMAIVYGQYSQDFHASVFDNHQTRYQAETRLGAAPASGSYHLATVDAGYCGPVEQVLELSRWRKRAS